MKDLQPSRLIHVITAGSLLVSVSSCAPTPQRAAKKMCKAFKSCNESEFEDEWDDLAECTEQVQEYIDYQLEGFDEKCEKAYSKYLLCQAREYAKDCDYESAYEECEDLLDDAYDICND